jgi:formate dehydrogenase major subunit
MTNHWVDIKNTDVVMVNGSNAAENHPASMTWIHKAREDRKAKLIVVDPRFSRSAAKADLYVPIRSGTDLAFYGGLFKHILLQWLAGFRWEAVLK